MSESDFFEWLDDFITRIENPELPFHKKGDDYFNGLDYGRFETQKEIARKLRYALEVHKKLQENK